MNQKIEQAKKDGYITGAFGLRVRTPLLKNAGKYLNRFEQAEARTAGNALGQGWGLLNNRAMRAIIQSIDDMGYSDRILPIMQIHDAGYFLVQDDPELVTWLNTQISKETLWNDDPIIYHDEIQLGGEMDIFYPNWANPLTIPPNASTEEIIELCESHSY